MIAVVQPHRYTRLHDLFDEFCACFNDADAVIVADVYAAGEAPIEGVDRDALVEGLRRYGHRRVLPLDGPADLPALVARGGQGRRPGGLLGAGDITAWAYALPDQLDGAGRGGRMSWRDTPAGGPRQAAAATSRWRPSPGSGSAGRPTCCSCRPTRTTWPASCSGLPTGACR